MRKKSSASKRRSSGFATSASAKWQFVLKHLAKKSKAWIQRLPVRIPESVNYDRLLRPTRSDFSNLMLFLAKLQNTPRRVVSSPPFRSPSHVERRLFAVKGRPQRWVYPASACSECSYYCLILQYFLSVVRLQSKLNLEEDPLLQPFEIRNGRSGSMIRPRSLESDVLLLSLPR